MPTTTEVKENREWLAGQGYSVDIIFQPAKRVQWYKADGVPLPNLLPCDPYHIRQFRAKGWSLQRPTQRGTALPTEQAPLYVSDKSEEEKAKRAVLKKSIVRRKKKNKRPQEATT